MISVFMMGGANAQSCNASGNVTVTSTPGVVSISDNSTTSSGGAATYSWITFYDASTYTTVGSVSLQPYTNTGSFTFSQNGSYGYYLEVMDSITNCYDSIGGMFTISGLCDASFTYTNAGSGTFVFTSTGNYDVYSWDFGDGNTALGGNTVTNVFSANGSYNVCLTVVDSTAGCTDTYCSVVSVTGLSSGTCDASFYYFQDSIACDSINISALNGGYSNYYWDFGDGNLLSGSPYVDHQYASNGVYTIELAVYDYDTGGNFICADTTYQTVVVNCLGNTNLCDASAMIVDTSGYLYGIPNAYSANYDYYWDFGDGNTSTQPYPWHQYANNGTYNVCLTVVDSTQGCSDTQCYTYVSNAPVSCNANFYLFQDSVNAGVYYAWNMSSGNNLSYFWDFGDGNTSTQAYPIHTYSTIGVYQLCLTVTDGSCTSTYCDTINVVVKSNGTVLGVSQPGQFAGIEDVSVVDEMSLYPNPNNGQFNLNVTTRESGTFTISIMNYVGQLVKQNNVQLISGQNVIDMDLTNLPKGVYIINIADVNSGVGTNIKLIKE